MCPTFRDSIGITLTSAAIDLPAFRDRIEITLASTIVALTVASG